MISSVRRKSHCALSCDKALGQIAVWLLEVQPNGASARITYGVLNLAHKEGHASPAPLTPNNEITITLDLDHIAYRVPAGHRLGVAVSSAYWPLIWPSPEASALTLTDGTISLPLRPSGDNDEWSFEPPKTDD